MLIIVAVGILANGKTFPIAFLYYRAEDHELYAFFWKSLKVLRLVQNVRVNLLCRQHNTKRLN